VSETRHKRVESLLREELSRIIATGRIKDPRLQTIYSVTEVRASKDLKDARVYISVLDSGEEKNSRKSVVDALNHAAGYVQRLVGGVVRLRYTPRLRFLLDDSIRRGVELTHKLEDLAPREQ
jgi:ribosome-binding factor A